MDFQLITEMQFYAADTAGSNVYTQLFVGLFNAMMEKDSDTQVEESEPVQEPAQASEQETQPEIVDEVVFVEDPDELIWEEFTVIGKGEGKSKKRAIKAAHEDALDTARAECKLDKKCSGPSLVCHEEVEADKRDKGFKAVVVDRYQYIIE